MPCLVCRILDPLRVSRVSSRLIFFAVIYPCTSNAHESEIIPHDLTLLRKSPDVVTTAMFKILVPSAITTLCFFHIMIPEVSDRTDITYIDVEFHVEFISDVFRKIRERFEAQKTRKHTLR